MRTRFPSLTELASLPWFSCNAEARLCVSDPEVGPIIDVHTHLTLNYTRRGHVDLESAPGETQHYLPTRGPFNLDVYANLNISPRDRRRMSRDLTVGSCERGGMRATHTAPNLLREMAELGITTSVLLPIDFPWGSNTAGEYLRVAAAHPELIAMGSVHPFTNRHAAKLSHQKALGAVGIKLHPAVQHVHPSARRAIALYHHCGERGLPVLFHCGPVGIEPALGRALSQVRLYRRAIEACPDTLFILGHSGALQMNSALDLARSHDNVYLELSSQPLSGVQEIVDRAPPERLLFGTDWPFYHQALALAKVLLATRGRPRLRAAILRENAARVLRNPPSDSTTSQP
jgi:predicted TIM-barrel fold metal-dependent hydrolase